MCLQKEKIHNDRFEIMDKKNLRKKMILIRDTLTKEELAQKSKEICEKVLSADEYKNSSALYAFMPINSEVDILPVLEDAITKNKRLYLPKVEGDEIFFYQVKDLSLLKKSKYLINEPIGNEPKDELFFCEKEEVGNVFFIVPGLVFDYEGNRIGYGKGFYDKYFERLFKIKTTDNLKTNGVAFFEQIVKKINIDITDKKVNNVITDKIIINIKKEGKR